MTKAEIITKFHLQVDDMTELSSEEESVIFDEVYEDICNARPFEFTKKNATGTTSTSVPYIALPLDFSFLVQNANYTDISNEAQGPVVFVGTPRTPYKVVNYSDRGQYVDQDGYCYIDIVNSRLVFTKQPILAQAVDYDYHAVMADLGSSEEPVFPKRFHKAIYFGMAVNDAIIQQSDKARSYAAENQAKYNKVIEDLEYWNANLIQLN